jgi:DNA-binding NarL/FixJ family response regulator
MIKILIYEDSEDFADSIKDLINHASGMQVLAHFTHAKDAIRQIRLYKPDIVLMDIDMPVTNGLEGLRNIRAEKMEVTIIMLTVFDDNDRIFQSICYGASGYILKKTAPDKMISFIQEAQEGGAPMTPSVARQVLKLFSQPFQFNIELQKLTPRENDVLSLLVRGYSYK